MSREQASAYRGFVLRPHPNGRWSALRLTRTSRQTFSAASRDGVREKVDAFLAAPPES